MRRINDAGLALIKEFEGLRLRAYKDSGGILTIGYGHTGGIKEGMRITRTDAEDYLRADLELFEAGVENLTRPAAYPLNDNQFSALVCFAYNLGLERLRQSHLLRAVNQGEFQKAASDFLVWDTVRGVKIEGLTRRRQAERALFLKSIDEELS